MTQSATAPHILIVEDEEILQKFLVYHIEHAGYRATAISMGNDIMPTLQRDPADLILMDLGLPDGDGLTWTQQIREKSGTPIFVLTGRKGDDDRIMALGLGADDYLTKPCDPQELLLRIANILARQTRAATAPAAPDSAPLATPPSAPVPNMPAAPDMANAQPAAGVGGRRGDGRGDRRGGEGRDRRRPQTDRRQGSRRLERRGGLPSIAVLAVGAVALLAAGAGLTWFLLGTDEVAVRGPANDAPITQSSPDPATPSSGATPPGTDAPASAPGTLSRAVTALPQQEQSDHEPGQQGVTLAPDLQGDRPVAATSYSWVLKAKCPAIPNVAWWRVRNHTEIVRYVNTRHAGDWQPYIQSWTDRLNTLREILARDSGIRTSTGETLVGDTLKTYVDQTAQRVAAVNCLANAAAEFEYKRSQIRN